MTNIRRYHVPGATVFITAVCHRRQQFLAGDDSKRLLLAVMREVKADKPFRMRGYVILPDHFHCMLVPEPPVSFSQIVQSAKLRFTRRYKSACAIGAGIAIWQRRFWDHVIRDDADFERHLAYIHYNPVKHGYVMRPVDYAWSSFGRCVGAGVYPADWACSEEPDSITVMNLE